MFNSNIRIVLEEPPAQVHNTSKVDSKFKLLRHRRTWFLPLSTSASRHRTDQALKLCAFYRQRSSGQSYEAS